MPLSIMVKPASGLCNLQCAYCFYADVTRQRDIQSYGVMSEHTLELLVRKMFDAVPDEISLTFQGGEPTLAGKNYYRRLLALEKQYNRHGIPIHHAIQTNASLLDTEWCDIFLEGRFLVGVSLDGNKGLHDRYRKASSGEGTYEKAEQGIALLREYGIPYNILCVVHQQVAENASSVFESMKQHTYLQFIPCLDHFDGAPMPYSLQPETYGRFLIQLYDLYEHAYRAGTPVSIRSFDNWLGMLSGYPPEHCGLAGQCGRYALIEADGSVFPCDFYVLDQWRIASICDDSFDFRHEYEPWSRFIKESLILPETCRTCRWLRLCRGGCKRERTSRFADVSHNRFCEAYTMFFDARAERMKKMAESLLNKR